MGVNEEQEEISLVGKMLIELISKGSLAEQEEKLTLHHAPPLVYATQPLSLRAREDEKDMPKTREESWA